MFQFSRETQLITYDPRSYLPPARVRPCCVFSENWFSQSVCKTLTAASLDLADVINLSYISFRYMKHVHTHIVTVRRVHVIFIYCGFILCAWFIVRKGFWFTNRNGWQFQVLGCARMKVVVSIMVFMRIATIAKYRELYLVQKRKIHFQILFKQVCYVYFVL